MKKMARKLITIVVAAIMLFALAITASAETFKFDENPNCIWSISIDEGSEYTGFCDRVNEGYKYYSSNKEILFVEEDGTLIAKDTGYAVIAELHDGELSYYYGFTVNAQPKNVNDEFDDWVEERKAEREEERENEKEELTFGDVAPFIFVSLVLILVLAEIIYIFVTAPKFGMSRFWALAPIVGNVFGLVVFLVLKTAAKQNGATNCANVITCPVCNAKHPYGTSVCSICGAKLGQ